MTYPKPVLERAAAEFAEATSKPPFLFELGPEKGRETVHEVQGEDVPMAAAEIEDLTVAAAGADVPVRIYRPADSPAPHPVVLYIPGAGWVFGDIQTHERLVRELCVRSGAAVLFPHYSRSPESPYPVAIEQAYSVLEWIVAEGEGHGLDATRIAVAGDSVGGNMATVTAIQTKRRGGPAIRAQLLFYPVTDASFETDSYEQFATGYFLAKVAMEWFWDQYTTDLGQRAEVTASPLRATVEDLAGLPEALVITAEADVLRDEGEAYAAKLREAGVPVTAVRYQGIIHDFVMLNALRDTYAAKAATAQGGEFLRRALNAP
jgi:acetyl esterase